MSKLYMPERPRLLRPDAPVLVTPKPGRLGLYSFPESIEFGQKLDDLLRRIGGGAAGTWTFTNIGRISLLNGTFDLDTDTFKMALLTSGSNIAAATTTHAGVTGEVANGVGYTTGGITIVLTLAGTTTVTVDIQTDPVWTATGGSITARYAEIYEVSGNVLCYALLDAAPADVTATDGNTLTVAAHASGVFTLA